jgi:hypothetical protein
MVMPPDETTRWILIGAAAAGAFYLLVLRPRLQKHRRRTDPLDRTGGLSHHRSVEREMSNLLVELAEMSRQLGAQIDTRAARLEVLIQQADERIAILRSLGEPGNGSRDNRGVANSGADRGNVIGMTTHPESPSSPMINPAHAEVYALADQGNTLGEIAARLGRPSGEIELILALRSNR